MNDPESAIETIPPVSNEQSPTDAQLLTRFIEQRDQAAFKSLLLAHGPMVFGVCLRILKRFQDAEDAYQVTFLSLARNAARVGRPELVANWLYTVARRAAIRLKKNAAKRGQVELQLEQPMSTLPESTPDHGELWLDVAPVLDREIGRLSDDLRAAVIMCDVEGKTRKEAARQLGCPEATVSTRLMKARSLLARRLSRRGVVLSAATLGVLLSQNAASAAVSTSLVATTIQAASVVSVGQAVSASLASPQVIAMTKGTLKSMLFMNLKTRVAVLILLATAGLGLQIQQEKQQNEPKPLAVAQLPQPNGQLELPLAIQKALEENAAQLNPVTIFYTEQLKTQLPEQDTFERLKITKYRSPRRMFQSLKNRVIWQEPKFYTFSEGINGMYSEDKGYTESLREHECTFDGSILYQGDRWKNPTNIDCHLLKERRVAYGHFGSSYFSEGFTGLSFPPFGVERESGMRAESSVLGSLRRGGELISVSESSIEDHPCIRVELRVENMEKTWADQSDLEEMKKMYSGGLYAPGEREQYLDNIVSARTLPRTKRVVFFLDPAMNYAVRQREEWYDPETLVSRSRCGDFEQLPNRQLWLPKTIEIDYRMYRTAPGVVFAAPFLSNVIHVTELSGEPAPDSQYVLDYKEPGTYIMDMMGTDTEGKTADKKTTDKQPVSVGYRVGQTPKETQRNREEAIRQITGKQTDEQRERGLAAIKPKSAIHWFMLANTAAFLSIGGFFAYRRFCGSK